MMTSVRSCLAAGLLLAATCANAADDGATVRLVSLAPNLTELVYELELEDHLVGRSSACDYPAAVAEVAVVGGFGRPNWEALWQVRPDVVIATDLEKPGVRQQLEKRGVTVLLLPCESWDELRSAAGALGDAMNEDERAARWVERLDKRLAALRERVAEQWAGRDPPRVYVEVWGRPVTTAGGRTFLHDVVEIAGGRNVGGDLRNRYPAVSSEWVIRENPEVILLAYMLADMQASAALGKRIGWATIDAIRNDRVIDHIASDLLLRPGPRLIDGAEQLADAFLDMMR